MCGNVLLPHLRNPTSEQVLLNRKTLNQTQQRFFKARRCPSRARQPSTLDSHNVSNLRCVCLKNAAHIKSNMYPHTILHLPLYMYIYIYTYIYIFTYASIYVYIYIYIYRERERHIYIYILYIERDTYIPFFPPLSPPPVHSPGAEVCR